MADQEPLETTKQQDAEQLPERIRVHALAKLLGVTSKRILAKLSELGADARSAQSNVDRAVAESVRDAFGPRDIDATAAAETAEPAPEPTPEPAPDTTEQPRPAANQGVFFSAPDPVIPGTSENTEPAHQPSVQLFTHPIKDEPHVAAPVVFEAAAAVTAPLFLPPDAAAAEQTRKKRRAERDARRVEEPPVEQPEDELDSTEDDQDATDQQGEGDDQPRRRRRGRRGRGRGRGEQHADADADDQDGADADTEDEPADEASESAESADADDTDAEDDENLPEGSSRRRRRRRRRKVAGESGENEPADDDPPNTVVHEREPRNKSRSRAAASTVDEVQGITGSTRLEAKRQRRRDGREAGRRRPPILTESEFLARREAVDRVMVVREKSFAGISEHSATTQVAVLEDNILVEHFVTNTGSASMVGNVYLGKVQNVLPSMEAAFVDIGRGRNGVLYAGEVNWEAAGLGGKERKIEQALKPGDQVLVQVSKDPVGHKGARLTTQISLAGRFLVYVPGGTSTGISRKLPDTERKRLKEILRDIVPADAGVIIRTASEGVSEAELARDVERLQATWRTIEKAAAAKDSGGPKTLYEEPDLLVKVIRDLFNEDFSRLVIEGERAWSTVENYIRTVAPDLLARVNRHESGAGSHPAGVDVFETFRIDEQLAKALDRKVWLPSGGTLVIDRTEAMTVIDVNTGKFTGAGGSNLEETVTRNNLEAAEEIVRQMRLRDIGGMIVVDFIDMVLESNRDLVLRRLTEALGRDRTRHQVSEVTSLGLVQMTRKKLGTGLVEAFSTTCEHCHGRGILVHTFPVEPSAAEDTGARTRESGSRRRRGRDKAAAPAAPAASTNGTPPVVEVAEEDIAVKRAHPVALAMAAHHHTDEDIESEIVEVVDAVAAEPEAVFDEVAEVVEAEAVDEVAEVVETAAVVEPVAVVETAPEQAEVVEPVAEPIEVAEPVEVVTETVATEPAPVEPSQEPARAETNGAPESAARPARRRRVARSASAPAADSSGAVFVLAADQPPAAPIDYSAPEPADIPQRKPRRRAVGRPAGAPEGTS
ncbi:translation initiation factor IF-2 N-terminal domain-containing protein [Nocardia sp. NPDC052566]|uniref:translation initiation factor IF-2 N-terminal domain-containing protein n=1 Tax=Nocardia sp. NPDC052566 TaxID=3364330 RepID=UPI0037CA497A